MKIATALLATTMVGGPCLDAIAGQVEKLLKVIREPATEPTEVFIVYSRRALYMGVICHDSDPTKWLGYQRRRDEFLQADDRSSRP